jgi:hypothetical protein
MRVSKTFYEAAGPYLYSNVIIKDQQPMSSVLAGVKTADKSATRCRPAVSNLKIQLLAFVQQITIATHTCKNNDLDIDSSIYKNLFPADLFSNLKTLLAIPYAECCDTEYLCGRNNQCPIITLARPQKFVLHNSRMYRDCPENFGKCCHRIDTRWPTLTLVLDETACEMADFRYAFAWDDDALKELRIIVCKTPAWLDKIAQRTTCTKDFADIRTLANGVVGPVISAITAKHADKSIAITIYLFRELEREPEALKNFNQGLDEGISYGHRIRGAVLDRENGPKITIKTLAHYIEEGLEDEFLWQELKYWRNENQRRSTEFESEEVSEIDEMVLGMFCRFVKLFS